MNIGDRPTYERNHLWRCGTKSRYQWGGSDSESTVRDDGPHYFLTHDQTIQSLNDVVSVCGYHTTRWIVLPVEYLGRVGNRDGLIDGKVFFDMLAEEQKHCEASANDPGEPKPGNDPKTNNDLIRGDAMNTHDGWWT